MFKQFQFINELITARSINYKQHLFNSTEARIASIVNINMDSIAEVRRKFDCLGGYARFINCDSLANIKGGFLVQNGEIEVFKKELLELGCHSFGDLETNPFP